MVKVMVMSVDYGFGGEGDDEQGGEETKTVKMNTHVVDYDDDDGKQGNQNLLLNMVVNLLQQTHIIIPKSFPGCDLE